MMKTFHHFVENAVNAGELSQRWRKMSYILIDTRFFDQFHQDIYCFRFASSFIALGGVLIVASIDIIDFNQVKSGGITELQLFVQLLGYSRDSRKLFD